MIISQNNHLSSQKRAIRQVIQAWSSLDDLVSFALNRHGYGDSNSGFGITYPKDLDDFERLTEKVCIPKGFVLVYGFWGNPDGYEMIVSEKDYLRELKNYFQEKSCLDKAQTISHLMDKLD